MSLHLIAERVSESNGCCFTSVSTYANFGESTFSRNYTGKGILENLDLFLTKLCKLRKCITIFPFHFCGFCFMNSALSDIKIAILPFYCLKLPCIHLSLLPFSLSEQHCFTYLSIQQNSKPNRISFCLEIILIGMLCLHSQNQLCHTVLFYSYHTYVIFTVFLLCCLFPFLLMIFTFYPFENASPLLLCFVFCILLL